MRGDLKELYEVLDAPDGEEWEGTDFLKSVINTVCGDDENNPGQFWTELMSNDKVSFAFESCYDSYPMQIMEIHSNYHCCDFPSKMNF